MDLRTCAKALLALGLVLIPIKLAAQGVSPFAVGGTRPPKPVVISVSYTFEIESEDKQKGDASQIATAERGRRMIYGMFSKECTVLMATIASECRLVRANVTSSERSSRNSEDKIRVNGSATFEIELKN